MIDRDTSIGEHIGNYRIVTKISSNPWSYVYQGEHTSLSEHPVSIKLWHSVHLSSQQQQQFLQEARLLKMPKHPHILPLLDIGIHNDMPYLLSEYVPGSSLRHLINH